MNDTTTQAQGAAAIDLDELQAAIVRLKAADLDHEFTGSMQREREMSAYCESFRPDVAEELIALARRATAPHAGAEPADEQPFNARYSEGDETVSFHVPLMSQNTQRCALAALRYLQAFPMSERAHDNALRILTHMFPEVEFSNRAAQPVEAAGSAVQAEQSFNARFANDTHFGWKPLDYWQGGFKAALATHPSEPVGGALVASIEPAAWLIVDGETKQPLNATIDPEDIDDLIPACVVPLYRAVPAGALVAKACAHLPADHWRNRMDATESAAAPADRRAVLEEAAALVLACHPKADRRGIATAIRQLATPTTQAEGKSETEDRSDEDWFFSPNDGD